MSGKQYNRWLPVLGAMFIQLCIGIVYIWSIFRTPLEQKFGWSTSDISIAFSINIMMIPIMMIAGGFVMQRYGPRVAAILGGVLVFIGMFVTSQATELWMLWFGYGVLTGGGVGMAYGVPIATLVKWFPDKRGFITGLAVGALGFGSILFAQVGYFFMESLGLMETFTALGALIFVGVIVGSLLMKPAPDGYVPEGWTPPTATAQSIRSTFDFTPKQMMRTPQFFTISLMYLFICICALGMLGHASPVGQSIAHLTPLEAASIVSILGFFNSGGRLAMGWASDKFGRMRSLCFLFILTGLAMGFMQHMDTYVLYALAASAVAFSFGGAAGIFPSITADVFGAKFVGINYGIVLLAYGVGGVIGPIMMAVIKEATGGDYSLAFIIGAAACAVGVVLCLIFKPARHPDDIVLPAGQTEGV